MLSRYVLKVNAPASLEKCVFLTDAGTCRVENASHQSICDVSTAQRAEGDYSTVPSRLIQPVMQDAGAQASVQANTENLWEQTDRLESPIATSTSRVTGEDAQVQTLPMPPKQHMDNVPSAANTSGKKDTATLTGELHSPDLKHALFHTSESSSCQDSTPGAPAATKAPSIYATQSEPKPKPSNELTRNYIPKVGMTTYTIVPQKSLEKLRYFEVALTLEAPPAAAEDGLNIGSTQSEKRTAQRGQTEVSKEKSELHSPLPREDFLTNIAAKQVTVNQSASEFSHFSSPSSLPQDDGKIASSTNNMPQAGSPAQVKEKIPPATKPKPGSFRLTQHKKSLGYYVTSAAEKNLPANLGFSQREAQANAEGEKSPPPPCAPFVQCQEESTGATNIQLSPKEHNKSVAVKRLTRQSSLPCKEPNVGLSLDKLRSFAAPKPYSSATPSRFAQAVSSAVKRSQSLSHGPKSPHSPVSPLFSSDTTSVTESKGPSIIKVSSDRIVC